MSAPAALPAITLCIGVIAGVLGAANGAAAVLVLCLALIAGGWAFARRRDRATVLALSAGFLAAGALFGGLADEAATRTPLRDFYLEQTGGAGDAGLFVWLEGRLRRDAARGPTGTSLVVSADWVEAGGARPPPSRGVLVSVNGTLGQGRTAEWRAGRRVRLPALLRRPARYLDPGVGDSERGLAWRGITLVASVKSPALVDVMSKGSWLSEGAAAARMSARRAIDRGAGHWSARSAAVVQAILIGDRAGLDREVERRLQEAGTYHVIAISGGNIAMLAGLFLGVLRLCQLPQRVANLLAVAFLSAYAYFVGGGSSVDRATVMAVAYLSARLLDQRTGPINAVAVAGAIILSSTPLAVADPGFVLTFGATLGIVLGARSVLERIGPSRAARAPALLLAASLSAEAALLPVSAIVFSRVTFAGLLLNFAALPLMTLVQVAGIATLGAAGLGTWPVLVPGYVAHLAVQGLVESARLIDLLPWLVRRVPPPEPATVALYYAGIAAWYAIGTRAVSGTAWRSWRWRIVPALAPAGVLAAMVCIVAGWRIAPGTARPGLLRVAFLDVGQGDATFVQFPNGRTLLVDSGGAAYGGADIGSRVVVPALWAMGVRRLDYLALSHGDPDHDGGAPSVLRDLRPREVWEGTPVPRDEFLAMLRRDAGSRGAAWRELQAGDRVAFQGASLSVWHPPPGDWERQRVRDDDSLVMELAFGRVSVVLTGDIGAAVERELARRQDPPPAVRVLKVPHHGSATSSSVEFLEAMGPRAAVISAGRGNPFGHPAESVLERYRAANASVLRTDRDGAIVLETDGREVWIRTQAGRTVIRLP